MEACLIVTTVPNIEEAKKIAHTLVEGRFAACVNIIPGVTSVYSWENKVVEDNELTLLIKTRKSNFNAVRDEIVKLHSYTVPEIIMVPVKKGLNAYCSWIKNSTNDLREL